ncbi:hypothetical protein GQ53DRAFT_822918 [Thozetella sp. PMI_491]|nr:hypothetical protein GQ53DRAFT_822918 [Thozetella sp. PMI_491]
MEVQSPPTPHPVAAGEAQEDDAVQLGVIRFRYSDIDPAQEMRLLSIAPCQDPHSPDEEIQCQLVPASLDQPPAYTAISYVWGHRSDTQLVYLEGCQFPITASLRVALLALRHAETPVRVWADAVCINQNNNFERSQQVMRMAAIYRMATRVAFHVGPEDASALVAFKFLEDLAAMKHAPDHQQKFDTVLDSSGLDSPFGALVSLFRRDYWNRIWIIQEICNAKEASLFCGSTSIPWTTYKDAMALLQQNGPRIYSMFGSNPYTTDERKPWSSYLAGHISGRYSFLDAQGHANLYGALVLHRAKACSDPRDKIFGLLGVVTPAPVVNVDYNLSVAQVYTEATVSEIRRMHTLRIILYSTGNRSGSSPDRLPTWVPDWSFRGEADYDYGDVSSFDASPRIAAHYKFSQGDSLLTTAVIPLLAVNNFSLCSSSPASPLELARTFLDWYRFLSGRPRELETLVSLIFSDMLPLPRDGLRIEEILDIVLETDARKMKSHFPWAPLEDSLQAYVDKTPPVSDTDMSWAMRCLGLRITGRRLLASNTEGFCIGPSDVREHDLVCLPLGCPCPIVVRQVGGKFTYQGFALVSGYMGGEAIQELKERKRRLMEITIM